MHSHCVRKGRVRLQFKLKMGVKAPLGWTARVCEAVVIEGKAELRKV